ncbi:MAG: TonB-dependent receptor, partial [Alphaproteobacteria bacterium]|nr:TonB-dependent receptor [Alphaproteobacteria bacterium]
PYKTNASSFFGAPNENVANTQINSVYGTITHDFDKSLALRNSTRFTNNHKFYRNVVPGTISGTTLSLSAYQTKSERDNFTNQTDLTKKFETGSVKHVALFGVEVTSQNSTKVRSNVPSSSSVSLSNPITYDSFTYSTIAQNLESDVRVLASYLQDQADINEHLQLTAGLRLDKFETKLKDRANNKNYGRIDTLLSPRAGLVIKPQKSVSFYGSYGVTYQPSVGDQFDTALITSTTAFDGLEPEKIQNYEVGAKWDVTPKINLSAALFQLNRSNTPATNESGYVVLTGQSRTKGLELAVTGKITDEWQTILGYSFQDAVVTKATNNYSAGKKVALIPHNSFSLWNKYDFTKNWAAGLGVVSQSHQFAGANNSVILKGFTRFDGALYYRINPSYRLQLNVENLFDRGYAQTAHNNSNILPGSPRAFKAALIADF